MLRIQHALRRTSKRQSASKASTPSHTPAHQREFLLLEDVVAPVAIDFEVTCVKGATDVADSATPEVARHEVPNSEDPAL